MVLMNFCVRLVKPSYGTHTLDPTMYLERLGRERSKYETMRTPLLLLKSSIGNLNHKKWFAIYVENSLPRGLLFFCCPLIESSL